MQLLAAKLKTNFRLNYLLSNIFCLTIIIILTEAGKKRSEITVIEHGHIVEYRRMPFSTIGLDYSLGISLNVHFDHLNSEMYRGYVIPLREELFGIYANDPSSGTKFLL